MNEQSGWEAVPVAEGRTDEGRSTQTVAGDALEVAVPHQRPDTHAVHETALPAHLARLAPPSPSSLSTADPLTHEDPCHVANAAASENLLRCWIRETGLLPDPPGPDGRQLLHLPLAHGGLTVMVPVRHWSATGWHRFGTPTLVGADSVGGTLDAMTLAALLAREASGTHAFAAAEDPAQQGGRRPSPGLEQSVDLVGRVAESVQQTTMFLAERRVHPRRLAKDSVFLDSEQSLLLGHPLHPAPKSRGGLTEAESWAYSPELRGSFPLHWYAVDRSVLAADSAWTERGRKVSAERLATVLAGSEVPVPKNTVPLPLHPWQARDLRTRAEVNQLMDQRLLFDLGSAGEPWSPTSSVRTVYQPGTAAMLKLSLGLRITNSRRENLRKELHRGVEVHRLLRTGLADEWRAAFPTQPGFDVVRDPAWLAVDTPDGTPVPGLDTVIRHSPFGHDERAVCLAALTSPRPWPDRPPRELSSPLARTVQRLAARTGRRLAAVSVEWLLRYLRSVVRPILWLDAAAGIALEAHQQNTLVLLDSVGWPEGGRYRDNQGYYFRASRRQDLRKRLAGVGDKSDSFVDDDVINERFAYYLGINNVFGLIGAFGAEHLADEELLLAAFRRFLAEERAPVGPEKPASPLPALLLESPVLRCKANLLTRLHGLDELVGPVDTQSVYVPLHNPLACG